MRTRMRMSPAPSTFAASYSSSGRLMKKDRRTTRLKALTRVGMTSAA